MNSYCMIVWEDWIGAESISDLEDLRLASKQRGGEQLKYKCMWACTVIFIANTI